MVEEVGRGDGWIREDEGQGDDGDRWERDGRGRASAGMGVGRGVGGGIVPGVVRAIEEVLNNLLGGDDVDLVDVVDGGPRGDGEGGWGDGGGTSERWGGHWLKNSQIQ